VLITAHYDVVPVEEDKWTVPPFGGELRDGRIYGRGAIDMKNMLTAILEAAETLMRSGFVPHRDVWFVFGGDEERTGMLGARNAAQWLADRKLRFSWVLDEGTPVALGYIPGVDTPLALVSIEEKGYLSIALTVRQEPGHSSRPPKVQAAAILGKALARIESRPFPWRLVPTAKTFFRRLAEISPAFAGMTSITADALGDFFTNTPSASPYMASLLHTTAAMTELFGSSADNVMPSEVKAVINLRLLAPWTIEKAIKQIQNVIQDDRVEISIHGSASEAVPANPTHAHLEGPGTVELQKAIGEVFPGVPILPFIMTATTDSRHYKDMASGIFRFNPVRMTPKDMAGMHGHDEYISVENALIGPQFYQALFRQL
jgi:carboxypeptidase PM20D1